MDMEGDIDEDLLMEELMEEFDELDVFDESDDERRPYDDWAEAGLPVDPPPWDWTPDIRNGGRLPMRCFGLEGTGVNGAVVRVLLRYPVEVAECAYLPVLERAPIITLMGHLQIHHVLRVIRPEEDVHDAVDEVENEVAFELTPELVAIKVSLSERMERHRGRFQEDPMKEIMGMQLASRSDARHVLGCREVIYDDGTRTLNVVMRFCQQGDMFDLIRQARSNPRAAPAQTGGLPEEQARYWIFQIVLGLQELRSLGICHRDLSPENIMMDANESLVVDLGLCLRVPYIEEPMMGQNVETILSNRQNRLGAWRRRLTRPQGAVGKLPYMSPEIFLNELPFDGEVADVWSLGIILFCMLTGQRSYGFPHQGDVTFLFITTQLGQLLDTWNIELTFEAFDLLSNMLKINPRDRLTLDEVANHPWFGGHPRPDHA